MKGYCYNFEDQGCLPEVPWHPQEFQKGTKRSMLSISMPPQKWPPFNATIEATKVPITMSKTNLSIN
jgi:hypothetical protein